MTTGSIDSVDRIIVQADERLPAVLQIIDAARRRLDLSIFRCDEPAVLEALGRAAARGVHVRALVTGKAKGSKAQLKQLRKALKASGVEVRRYADPIVRYHAKYVVADEHTAMVASLNFTKKCFGQTCDFMLVSSDAALVGVLAQLFEADWAGIGIAEGDAGRLIIGPEQARALHRAPQPGGPLDSPDRSEDHGSGRAGAAAEARSGRDRGRRAQPHRSRSARRPREAAHRR